MTIDWYKQWESFAVNFHTGKAHIDLSKYGTDQVLLLEPGPGFGDLSHPTTNLMLEMMKGRIEGKKILDIGSGSGILTLASLYLGARSALGVEIDSTAVEHAKRNAALNHLRATFSQSLKSLPIGCTVLINMIFSEQKRVPNQLFSTAHTIIVSGILEEQKESYLKHAKRNQWILQKQYLKEEWVGFVFDKKP